MNFGGPVWHASARSSTRREAEALARRALLGVGAPASGEWREAGITNAHVVHFRRRLTPDEALLVGPVRDIRGSTEERERFAALLKAAPHLARIVPLDF